GGRRGGAGRDARRGRRSPGDAGVGVLDTRAAKSWRRGRRSCGHADGEVLDTRAEEFWNSEPGSAQIGEARRGKTGGGGVILTGGALVPTVTATSGVALIREESLRWTS